MILAAGSKLSRYEIQVLLDSGGTHKFVPLSRGDVSLWRGVLFYFEGPLRCYADRWQTFPYKIREELPVTRP